MRLDRLHEQAITRPLPHDELVQLHCVASQARVTTAPGAGVAITAGFEFDVPVRFDTDMLDVTLDLERLGSILSIPLLEIRR